MKNLVVCCDGTWNTPDENKGGVPCPTNVVKLRNALIEDATQQVYYHSGVGTGPGLKDRILGGGTGEGLDANIKSAYNWLARHYRPNDRIYLFGFSRGAYTARSAAGLIAKYGLLDLSSPNIDARTAWSRVDAVFAAYRGKQKPFANPDKYPFYNEPEGGPTTTPIYFIGVWDTVGSLGIPTDFALLGLFDDIDAHKFHNTELSDSVGFARHAIALDEKRASFAPTLWKPNNRTNLKQIWFPGVHSDVGGGYVETGLSDGALQWMIGEAKARELKIRDGAESQIKPDALGLVHDSCTGVFGVLRSQPRSVPKIAGGADDLHASVDTRLKTPSLTQGTFWATMTLAEKGDTHSMDIFAAKRWNPTGLYLEKGITYAFEATGEWLDRKDKFSPDGTRESAFSFGDAIHHVSDVLGSFETIFNRLRNSKDYDFWFTRRIQDQNWFALIGFIANDANLEDGLPKGETFRIGSRATFTPASGGYLYCYANDAWQTYNNNKGSVFLKVTRS